MGTNDSEEEIPIPTEPYLAEDGTKTQLERMETTVPNDQHANDIQFERQPLTKASQG